MVSSTVPFPFVAAKKKERPHPHGAKGPIDKNREQYELDVLHVSTFSMLSLLLSCAQKNGKQLLLLLRTLSYNFVGLVNLTVGRTEGLLLDLYKWHIEKKRQTKSE